MVANQVVTFDRLTQSGAVRNLAGKERGRAAREELDLDTLDHADLKVVFQVSSELYAITDSFLMGLLSKSISTLGGLDKFYEHYDFEADPIVKTQILRGLERAAAVRKPLIS